MRRGKNETKNKRRHFFFQFRTFEQGSEWEEERLRQVLKRRKKKIKRESGTRKAGGVRVRVISEITYEVSVDESHQSVKASE